MAAEWLSRETPWPESYTRIFTFGVLAFLSWLSLRLLFAIVGKLIHLEVAAPFQILGGGLIGGLRYFLFFCLISYFLTLFPLDFIHRSYQVQSWSGQILVRVAPRIYEGVRTVWTVNRGVLPKTA